MVNIKLFKYIDIIHSLVYIRYHGPEYKIIKDILSFKVPLLGMTSKTCQRNNKIDLS